MPCPETGPLPLDTGAARSESNQKCLCPGKLYPPSSPASSQGTGDWICPQESSIPCQRTHCLSPAMGQNRCRLGTSRLPVPVPTAGLTWQVVKANHLVKVLVVCSHLREERAFGDSEHGGLLGDVGLEKEQRPLNSQHRGRSNSTNPEWGHRSPWPSVLA